jgi:hypothetical protein
MSHSRAGYEWVDDWWHVIVPGLDGLQIALALWLLLCAEYWWRRCRHPLAVRLRAL